MNKKTSFFKNEIICHTEIIELGDKLGTNCSKTITRGTPLTLLPILMTISRKPSKREQRTHQYNNNGIYRWMQYFLIQWKDSFYSLQLVFFMNELFLNSVIATKWSCSKLTVQWLRIFRFNIYGISSASFSDRGLKWFFSQYNIFWIHSCLSTKKLCTRIDYIRFSIPIKDKKTQN